MIKLILSINNELINTGLLMTYPREITNNELKIISFFCIDNINNTDMFVKDILEYLGYHPMEYYNDHNDYYGLFDKHESSITSLTLALHIFIDDLKEYLNEVIGYIPNTLSYLDDTGFGILVGVDVENN